AAPATSSPGAGTSEPAALSRDGRFVAFSGSYTSLLPGQSQDIRFVYFNAFLYDRLTDSTVMASHAGGDPTKSANGSTVNVDLSADGRFLVFASNATDLIPGLTDTNGTFDIFVYDRDTGALTLVSRSAGSPSLTADARSFRPLISADGRFIVFGSSATDLVAGQIDASNTYDVFLHDRITGVTSLV